MLARWVIAWLGLMAGGGICLAQTTPPLTEIFKRVDPAVVVIRTTEHNASRQLSGANASITGLGSGVVISADGLVMTAAHVIQLADAIAVEFVDGYLVTAKVVASSVLADVALIKLDETPKNLVVAEIGDSDQVEVGQNVFVIGAPYGFSHSLTVGHISGRRRPRNAGRSIVPIEYLQTDAAINQGNSGGPLFTLEGRLIGIVSHIQSHSGGYEGLGFAATINMARELLLERGAFWTGIEFLPIEGELADALNVPQSTGLLVQRVAKRSPGARLGLRAGSLPVTIGDERFLIGGDILLEVAGLQVEDSPDFVARLNERFTNLAAGDRFTVKVLRGGAILLLSAVK